MVFSDLFFLFAFLPLFMLLYRVAGLIDKRISNHREAKSGSITDADVSTSYGSHPARNIVLIFFSLLFYSWGEPVYVLLMIVAVLVNYVVGRIMMVHPKVKKPSLYVGVALNIFILGTYKYTGFLASILQDIGIPATDPKISLPIGISFYIFQSISYLVDIYRSDAPVQKNYFSLLLYISMFPQLIAGPIVRYGTVAQEINSRHATHQDVAEGAFRFLIGLGKKVILANQLGDIATHFLTGDYFAHLTTSGAWAGIIAFCLQIYFDFSGYSDMAIGIGRCLGFHFPENFNHPYISSSATEFWRRWHMSLGSFFRDYVYIPLGGNRAHQWLNILIVWALTGLWHGASWNFLFWGLYYGIIIAVEKFTILPLQKKYPNPLFNVYLLLVVIIGFGFFYFDSMSSLRVFFKSFFGAGGHGHWDFESERTLFDNFWLWISAIFFCMPVRNWVGILRDKLIPGDTLLHTGLTTSVKIGAAVILLLLSVTLLIGATNNAFLYTRF